LENLLRNTTSYRWDNSMKAGFLEKYMIQNEHSLFSLVSNGVLV
jgi:hypothetical protein